MPPLSLNHEIVEDIFHQLIKHRISNFIILDNLSKFILSGKKPLKIFIKYFSSFDSVVKSADIIWNKCWFYLIKNGQQKYFCVTVSPEFAPILSFFGSSIQKLDISKYSGNKNAFKVLFKNNLKKVRFPFNQIELYKNVFMNLPQSCQEVEFFDMLFDKILWDTAADAAPRIIFPFIEIIGTYKFFDNDKINKFMEFLSNGFPNLKSLNINFNFEVKNQSIIQLFCQIDELNWGLNLKKLLFPKNIEGNIIFLATYKTRPLWKDYELIVEKILPPNHLSSSKCIFRKNREINKTLYDSGGKFNISFVIKKIVGF